jgi:hypothetical protein
MQLVFLSRIATWFVTSGNPSERKLIALSDELDAELARLLTDRTYYDGTDDTIRHLLARSKELNAQLNRHRVERHAKTAAN